MKIFLEQIRDQQHTTWIQLKEGIESNPKTELVYDISDADLCFYHFLGDNIDMPLDKTVYFDFNDGNQLKHLLPVKLYLKRSVVGDIQYPSGIREAIHYPEYVKPFSHTCILNVLRNQTYPFNTIREYDVISTFREPDGPGSKKYGYAMNSNQMRTQLQTILRDVFNSTSYKTRFAEFNDSNSGEFESSYINHLKNSKIIITMNPYEWEGDNRLYESLASGALVFCDTLYANIPDKFIDGKHLIYYNPYELDDLISKIVYYLENENERIKIARCGYEFVHEYHTPSARIDQVLKYLSNDNNDTST